ncbi:MAG: peptide chain release factor N(5)-glutamine methyltransferase [Culturomica sp.]|jgi:release factor glutamine methyltransferase|nr:peptide chain release factor N(5)-glutamine methyltransferase [Culturomica sp.]
MNSSIFTTTQYAINELKDTYPEEEVRSICRLIFSDIFQYTNIEIHLKKYTCLPESFVNKFYAVVEELKQGRPVQYIIGETEFAGLRFRVDESTLIPRPETEELVRWAGESVRPGMRILDIGTGSGCIAVAIAKRTPGASVCGMDISPEALAVAKENAARNKAEVFFGAGDILAGAAGWDGPYDLIISNPPYVREFEKAQMARRVVAYEPEQALFVPDSDPLLFYRAIARFGRTRLTPGGLLFVEINEALEAETVRLLQEAGYAAVTGRKDLFGKPRFIRAEQTDLPYGS